MVCIEQYARQNVPDCMRQSADVSYSLGRWRETLGSFLCTTIGADFFTWSSLRRVAPHNHILKSICHLAHAGRLRLLPKGSTCILSQYPSLVEREKLNHSTIKYLPPINNFRCGNFNACKKTCFCEEIKKQ